MVNTDPQKIEELLTRGVHEVIDKEHLRQRLLSGETLRVKLGIDPTSPNIHIGRSVSLLKLRQFQDLGHTAVFIVGDETGKIGDTSDKESERPMLTQEQITENMQDYLNQAYKILDPAKTETHYNSEWLSKLGLMELAKMANLFSVKEFSSREVIARRLEAGQRVSFHEMMYPIFQGYDSVAIKADVELGGTDQRFNLLAGRQIQPLYSQEPQDILMTNLIMGLDGRKMSSSWGNTINVTDSPNNMFQKAMSLSDDLIVTYLEHCTRVPQEEITEIATKLQNGLHPREAKMFLAQSLVTLYHSPEQAQEAHTYYETVSKGEVPQNILSFHYEKDKNTLVDLLVGLELAKSKSEARRKIEQGGVTLDGQKILDPETLLTEDMNGKVFKVGKKDFARIQLVF